MADMIPEIESRQKLLRVRKLALAARVMEMSEQHRKTSSPGGGLSPAQLVGHLAQTEEFNLGYLRKTSPSSLKAKTPAPGFLYERILKTLRAYKRMATPPMLAPKKGAEVAAEARRLEKLLNEMDLFFGQVQNPNAAFIKMNFLFGTLSANQYFDFQDAHVSYHEHYFPRA